MSVLTDDMQKKLLDLSAAELNNVHKLLLGYHIAYKGFTLSKQTSFSLKFAQLMKEQGYSNDLVVNRLKELIKTTILVKGGRVAIIFICVVVSCFCSLAWLTLPDGPHPLLANISISCLSIALLISYCYFYKALLRFAGGIPEFLVDCIVQCCTGCKMLFCFTVEEEDDEDTI